MEQVSRRHGSGVTFFTQGNKMDLGLFSQSLLMMVHEGESMDLLCMQSAEPMK